MKTISLIIPVYCEEEVVEEFYRRVSSVMNSLANYKNELIFVNDGSSDNTLPILNKIAILDKKVKILSLSRNFGHQIAITAGMDRCNGDAIVIIDADLQDPPEVIPKMIKKWEEGYKVVYGKRSLRKGENKFKLWSASLFYRILRRLTDIKMPLDTGDFRLFDRRVLEVMKNIREKNRYIRGLFCWVGFSQIGLEYEREERFLGRTKYPLKRMIKFALDGILSFSHRPLKVALSIGFFSIIIGILMVMYVFLGKIFFPSVTVPGWASILIAVVFFGGVQLFTIGILGEYIGRIYDETKDRPLYIIEDETNFEE